MSGGGAIALMGAYPAKTRTALQLAVKRKLCRDVLPSDQLYDNVLSTLCAPRPFMTSENILWSAELLTVQNH